MLTSKEFSEKFSTQINLWCRGKENVFPRELGLNRVIVKNEEELISGWKDVDEYMSVFNLKQRFYEKYDTIYFDVDGKTNGTEEAFEKVKKVYSKFPHISRCYYSGVGYHLFVDLLYEINGKGLYKEYVRQLVEKYGIKEYLDPSVLGDVSRVARVPNSINSKSGKTMVLIDLTSLGKSDKPEQLVSVSTTSVPKISFEQLNLLPNEIEEKKKIPTPKAEISWESKYGVNYPPCITNSIKMLSEEGELNHSERLHLATFLINIGKEKDLREYLKLANDYSESITDYQINYLKEREMSSFSCDRVEDDICSYVGRKRLCPFYPSVNVAVRRLKNETR